MSFRASLDAFRRAHPNVVLSDAVTGEDLSVDRRGSKAPVEIVEASLVEPSVQVVGGKLVMIVPAVTHSLTNERRWAKTMRKKLSVKRAMREVLGPHHAMLSPFAEAYHAGKQLRVKLVRLGGRRLDRTANLGPALKTVEDVLAAALLADDGDPRWRCEVDQEPGGKIGVRIEVQV